MPYIKDLNIIRDSFGRKIEMFDLLYQEEFGREPFAEFYNSYNWFIVVPSYHDEYEAEIRDLGAWNVCMLSITNNVMLDPKYAVLKWRKDLAPQHVLEEYEISRLNNKGGD